MRQYEQDWLELGSRVARSLHYQHRRNLRQVEAAEARERLSSSASITHQPPSTSATRHQSQ
jgi:hypothetical protein